MMASFMSFSCGCINSPGKPAYEGLTPFRRPAALHSLGLGDPVHEVAQTIELIEVPGVLLA